MYNDNNNGYIYEREYGRLKKQTKRRTKKNPPHLLIITDILLIAVAIFVFSLFNHVLPSFGGEDLSKQDGRTATPPRITPARRTPDPEATGEQGTEEIGIDTIDYSNWGYKFPDKFTDGEIISTETTYKSKDIDVTVTKVQENGVTYFIQDIYVRKIECFRTAFAKDKQGRGYVEGILSMAKNNQAICAINGDYYGAHPATGGMIRNGFCYDSGRTDGEVCVLYYDGTMKVHKGNFYNDQVSADNGYQSWFFGPSLLSDDGRAMTEFKTTVSGLNPRTAVGYYEPGHYCFVLVDGRQDGYSKGMRMAELSKLFETLGCKVAYNLDGGQTSTMTFMDKVANQPYNGGRSCSDILFICEWTEE